MTPQTLPQDGDNSGLLGVTDPEGVPLVRNRVPTVKEAYQVYRQLVQGDRQSRLNRLRYQMQEDGAPPYSETELRKYGLADVANLNFGFMADAMELAEAPYNDLIQSSETLARLPVTFGDDPEQRLDWQNTIEVEHARLITQSEGFDYDFNCLTHQFILHGVSAPYFADTLDFEWTVGTVADFLIPRHTRAKTSAIEVACIEKFYLAHELFEKIQEVEAAETEGWDPYQTWQIIKQARSTATDYGNNPERLETDFKDNDMSWQARSREMRVVHMFVRALDGSVSHLMFDADGDCTDFMYKKIGKFKEQSEAFTVFTYGVGQNEFYHGIRGLGYKLSELVSQMNQLWSAFIDAIRMNGKMVLKLGTNADLKKLALVNFGHFIIPPPGSSVEPFQMPDLSKSMLPALNALSSLFQQKAASYTAPDQFYSKQAGRLKAIQARMEEVARLSVQKMNCFYQSWEKLLREQTRRIIRRDWSASDPGYKRVQEFFKRCERQGVPREAIHSIDLDGMEAVRAIGAGSAAARKLMMEELKEPISKCDEDGQYQFTRDQIRFTAGTEAANRYAPRKPGLRPPIDETIADMENDFMSLGQQPFFKKNQLHAVHANEHLKFIGEMIKESEEMKEKGVNDIRAVAKAPVMKAAYDHTEQHIAAIPEKMPDGQPNATRAELNEAFQQTGEAVNNNFKEFAKFQEEAMAKQQQQTGEQGQGQPVDSAAIAADQKAQAAIAMEQAKFQMAQAHEEAAFQAAERRKEEAHQNELRRNAEKIQNQIQIDKATKDALTAADIASKLQQKAA